MDVSTLVSTQRLTQIMATNELTSSMVESAYDRSTVDAIDSAKGDVDFVYMELKIPLSFCPRRRARGQASSSACATAILGVAFPFLQCGSTDTQKWLIKHA
ncbi:hypothetical protein EGR_10548 [Echinococcus granulosus]|uniref:Uncharacterized protein n=1 Tax=Echinococcus granulosus TaxID=6210 RepID=W6UM76_ECHGR|nr:hypothetical protein EGR_10548 [Echinococcus granulosus]EUB54594.1 hypothetical protein EGR_10548 [Echinococcus granulosus]